MRDDGLSAELISRGLGTSVIGRQVFYYEELGSTMTEASARARQGAVEGTVVIAGEQTAGKGRMNRSWFAPGGNVALSVILYPDLLMLPSLIMLASVAVVRCIKAVTGLNAGIKWPNDVLINDKKVCGILIESDLQGDRVNYSIIGTGIDANLKLTDFPEIQPIATSLGDELGHEISRLDVVRSLLVELDSLYLEVKSGGSVFEEWRDNMVTLGRKIRVTEGGRVMEGLAESVAADGTLMLRETSGERVKIVAGDVTLRE